jgi:hypothetical protein
MVEWTCVFAALCLMTANIIKIIFYVTVHTENHGKFNWESYTQLDPVFLEQNWASRIERNKLYMASGVMNSIGWLVFAYPVIQMAWILSKGGSRAISLNVVIVVLVLAGSLTELISNFIWLGMNFMSRYVVHLYEISEDKGYWLDRPDVTDGDGIGWRVLEVNHIMARGFVTFTDSFEWISLAGIFICTFASVRGWLKEDQDSFGSRWNTLGLFIGFVCILEFVAELLRFEEGMRSSSKIFAIVSIIYAILNRLVFIPAWIITLGFMLPRAAMKTTSISTFDHPPPSLVESELQLSEIQPNQATENFSIGDEDEDAPQAGTMAVNTPLPEGSLGKANAQE